MSVVELVEVVVVEPVEVVVVDVDPDPEQDAESNVAPPSPPVQPLEVSTVLVHVVPVGTLFSRRPGSNAENMSFYIRNDRVRYNYDLPSLAPS